MIHQHVILIVKLITNLLHSNASTAISGHQKLPACWLHSLKLSIRSRSITAIHLALNSHILKSQNRAMLLLTGKTLP